MRSCVQRAGAVAFEIRAKRKEATKVAENDNMSQHFTSILENLRFVTIKRTPSAQQQQQQQQKQQQSPLPATRGAAQAEQNKIKVKAPPQLNGNGLLSGNSEAAANATGCHELDHNSRGASGSATSVVVDGAGYSGGTPLKHPKRTSISTSSPQLQGRERRGTNTSIVVEFEESGGVAAGGMAAAASGSGTASSKSSRELSPSPKNQQPRKMSQDYRSRAGR